MRHETKMAYSILPELSTVAFVYWFSVGLVSIAFVAAGDGSIDANGGVSLAWYIVLLAAGTLSASWIVLLYMAAPNKSVRVDCSYRAMALSLAIPTIIVAGLAIIGGVSARYGDQVLLAILGSFWLVPIILWVSWLYYAYGGGTPPYPDCPFTL